MRAPIVWLTGWPASGKTTIAYGVKEMLDYMEIPCEVLDGDEVRQWLTPDCGFTRDDRDKNVLRVAEVAKRMARSGIVAIVALVSPFRSTRERVRRMIQSPFIEVYVKAPPEVCNERRNRKLLDKVKDFLAGDQPMHQEPRNPEVICYTDKETIEESVQKVIEAIMGEEK